MTTGYRPLFLSLFVLSLIFLFATEVHGASGQLTQPVAPAVVHHTKIGLQPRMFVEGMNNQGWIVGHWTDGKGETHWFVMNPFMPIFSDVSTHGVPHASGLTASPAGELKLAVEAGS